MPRSYISEILQWGVETPGSEGTPVAATVKSAATMIEAGPRTNINRFRPSGNKFFTVTSLDQEWVEATLTGPITYTEIIYWLSSLIDTVSPVDATPEFTWTFVPTAEGADTPVTYTFEYGSATRAAEFAYGLITGMTMRFSRQEVTFDASVIGRALIDGITLTAGQSPPALVPVTGSQVQVYLDDTAANLGTTALVGDFSVEWALTNRWGPVWDLNGQTYFSDHVDLEPELTVRMLVEANAANMALLGFMRADTTRFLRIEATGATIDTNPYRLTVDTAVKVTEDPSNFQDNDGVMAIEWSMRGAYDATWTQACEVEVVSTLDAL